MWKATTPKQTSKAILELLESDDELPDCCDEVPNMPAYENDLRFERLEPIKFEWLHQKLDKFSAKTEFLQEKSNSQEEKCTTNEILSTPLPLCIEECSTVEVISAPITEIKQDKKILISKGILTKRDIFFIKCIEEYSTDATLLWFIDFLKMKSEKPLQRSCLVGDIACDHDSVAIEPHIDFRMRYYFELIVN